jgi:uroporphyrinogen decarboxylase
MSAIKTTLNSVWMTGRKRVEAALALGVADRPPVGAWGHTYREEWSATELAAITVSRARRFEWDFVKFQPRASTFAEAFGSVYHPSGHALRAPIMIRPAVPDLDSWASVSLTNREAFDDQIESIGMVAREVGPGVPVIQTVFSPITVGGYLVGKSQSRVVRELRRSPEVVGPALEKIAEALLDFSRRSVEAGASGIFYAISGYAGRGVMKEDVYRDLVLPYDQSVLNELPPRAWFNVLHLCGSNLNFGLARDLPTQVVSWSIHNQGNPSLSEGRSIAGRAVMGGLSQRSALVYGPASRIEEEVRAAISDTGGRGLLIAPGCSVPPRVRESNLAAVMSAVAA